LIDAKDLIEDIGRRPEHRFQIKAVAAKASDPLRLLQRFRKLSQGALRVLTISTIVH
jgi:hypothetical protein